MNSTVAGVAASVVASVITYLLFDLADALSVPLRVLSMSVVLVVGIVITRKASGGRSDEPKKTTTKIGSGNRAKGDIDVKRTKTESAAGDTEIGSSSEADGTIRVEDTEVTRGGNAE